MFFPCLKSIRYALLFFVCVQIIDLEAQPVSKRSDITIKQAGIINSGSVRIKRDPVSGNLYILESNGNVRRVNLSNGIATFTTVYDSTDHGLPGAGGIALGMTFGQDGALYLVGNKPNGQVAVATIMKGVPVSLGSEDRTWTVLAKTVEYNYGDIYKHRMSGCVVEPYGVYLYVNSGARTDHGELRQGMRETGLTDIILRLPVNGENITLQDDREWLRSNGYLFAEGIRNDFDLAFSGSGDLFSVENSDDRDDPEEMNWLREGHFYGFPWRIGGDNTPQQYSPYDPHTDPLLSKTAWGGGNLYQTYSDDPSYPPRPAGVTFTEPVLNAGPDADKFRDTTTGQLKDASDLGVKITTFTAHRSPDGIVFDKDSALGSNLTGGAFVISINNGGDVAALGDTSADLLHLSLTKENDIYTAKTTRLIWRFNSPLGIELVGNKLYVVETGLNGGNPNPKLWEITLPAKTTTGINDNKYLPGSFELHQNYPNPFNPSTRISFSLPEAMPVSVYISNSLGQVVAVPVENTLFQSGEHQFDFNGKNLASGVYFYTLEAGGRKISKAMLLLK